MQCVCEMFVRVLVLKNCIIMVNMDVMILCVCVCVNVG